MAIPINPYVAGNPVGDSPAFIGRVDVLREVLRVLRRPQDNAIVLYGQRRIGKTSILQHLAARLPREGPYRPVYFDLQDKADWPLDRVLQELARNIAHALGQPDTDLGPDPETAFRQEWLPAVLDDLPGGSSLVLLFDEFDVLADPKVEQAAAAFFPYLRDLLTLDPQRLQFIFVIGRNVDDLTNIALSLFKGTPYQRVSLLDQEDTTDLVRLAEANDTLHWPDEAVERVWQLTHGHPFLTQQLGSHIWERAYDEEPDEPPSVPPPDVDAAVSDALEASRNTLEWLWDGLPPAERVVASALAEAGPGPITPDELEQLLHESGVRVVIRELQNAPQLLQDWDLIEPEDSGYRFRVELLRQWIAENKPLKRVQEELDRIEPVADYFYRAALGLYQSGQLDQAMTPLRQAIGLNPNHVGANQLLADILLAREQPGEARQLLERLYEYQPAAARSRLVQALLAQAQAADDDNEQLTLYERVLELDPKQPEATTGRQRIWQQRGDTALEGDELEAALEAYHEAGLTEKVAEVKQEMRRRALAARLGELEALEQEGRYQDALDLAHKLADEYPGMADWTDKVAEIEQEMRRRTLEALEAEVQAHEQAEKWAEAATVYEQLATQAPDEEIRAASQAALERCRKEEELARLFAEGVGALEQKDWKQAQRAFAEVVHRQPDYRKDGRLAASLLEQAVEKKKATALAKRLPGRAWALGMLAVLLLGGVGVLWRMTQQGQGPLAALLATPTPTATSTSTPTRTPTTTPTSMPTQTPTATPKVALPSSVSDTLSDVEVLYHDDFDELASIRWDYIPLQVKASGGLVEITGQSFWNTNLHRGQVFKEGEGVLVLFKYDSGAEFGLYLDDGNWQTPNYKRWGIYYAGTRFGTNIWQGSSGPGERDLEGNLSPRPDTWYYLLLAVGKEADFVAQVWEHDNPSQQAKYRRTFGEEWAGQTWEFTIDANKGKAYVDSFTEISFNGLK